MGSDEAFDKRWNATTPAAVHAYGPAITGPIANPAPIEHGSVMDDGWSFVAAEMRHETARSLRTLAANLAVGGALCAAYWQHGDRRRWDWRPGCGRAWGGGA